MKKNMKIFRVLNNQSGDILLIALMLVAISLISSLTLMKYSQVIQSGSRSPRVKSMMLALEAKIRSELLKPVNYNCPAGRDSCILTTTIAQITALSQTVPGAVCTPPATPCGFVVTVENFVTSPLTRATVKVRYNGSDLALRDTDIVMDIPADILQPTGVYQCPVSQPKFNGFNADGTMICVALPARASANQFVENITLADVITVPIPLPNPTNCTTDEILSQVKWTDGGKVFNFTCSSRADPFTVFGFNPQPAPGGDMTYSPNTD